MDITVERLRFSYNSSPLLDEIDLTVRAGEIFTILGPNGSGKTTLLKNISGVLSPDTGAIYLGIKRVEDLAPRERARYLAVVEQEREVGFAFTVREVVAMGRYPHQRWFSRESAEDARTIEEAMNLADVITLSRRSMQELSGGERQRVFLAMAFAQNPQVLLLDEPTAHLDINYQIQIMNIIQRQAKRQVTVLAAIHDLNLAAQYSHKIGLLHEGRWLALGSPMDVLTEGNIRKAFRTNVIVEVLPARRGIHIRPPVSETLP